MVGLQFVVGTSLPPLSYCNLLKLARCGIRTAQTNVLRAPGNYFDAGFRQIMGCIRRRAELHVASSQDEKLSRNCWKASERSYSIAGFRKLTGCIRIRAVRRRHWKPRPLRLKY
jgi:hypothetical protein